MNTKQKILTVVALLAFVFIGFIQPYNDLTLLKFHEPSYEYKPGGVHDFGPYGMILTPTGMEFLGVLVIYAGLFFVLRNYPKK